MIGGLAALWLGASAGAAPPTVGDWVAAWGEPSKGIALTERVRTDGEPLLLYWMQVQADPLQLGSRLAGTLVANFDALAGDLASSPLRSFTFLALAGDRELMELRRALHERDWVRGEATEARPGGTFIDYTLCLPEGRQGTLSVRTSAPVGEGMADGRPSPSLWVHVAPAAESDGACAG